jgi:hypothetical protein
LQASGRSALFDEQSGRAERPLACKNLGLNKIWRRHLYFAESWISE